MPPTSELSYRVRCVLPSHDMQHAGDLPRGARLRCRRMLTKTPAQSVENDSFEDAVDAASVRSLTKRSVSATKTPLPDDDPNMEAETLSTEVESPGSDMTKSKPHSSGASSPISSRISNASNLDNVELNDEAPAKAKGSWVLHYAFVRTSAEKTANSRYLRRRAAKAPRQKTIQSQVIP